MAGLAKHVYVLEFLPELKADQILQDKLVSLANVTVIKHAATKEISGTNQVESLSYIDRRTMEMHTLAVSGVFILVGLLPNTDWLDGTIEMNPRNEIVTEKMAQRISPAFSQLVIVQIVHTNKSLFQWVQELLQL